VAGRFGEVDRRVNKVAGRIIWILIVLDAGILAQAGLSVQCFIQRGQVTARSLGVRMIRSQLGLQNVEGAFEVRPCPFVIPHRLQQPAPRPSCRPPGQSHCPHSATR
jgi:hypothetical protein